MMHFLFFFLMMASPSRFVDTWFATIRLSERTPCSSRHSSFFFHGCLSLLLFVPLPPLDLNLACLVTPYFIGPRSDIALNFFVLVRSTVSSRYTHVTIDHNFVIFATLSSSFEKPPPGLRRGARYIYPPCASRLGGNSMAVEQKRRRQKSLRLVRESVRRVQGATADLTHNRG